MAEFTHVRKGYKFVVTDAGKQIGKIRAKYEDGYVQKVTYEKSVPLIWVTNGYVKEVPVNGEIES